MKFGLIYKLLTGKKNERIVSIRTLIKFLRKHKIRRVFIYNNRKYPLILKYESINDMCNDIGPINWFRMAFRWNGTQEGLDYWENINTLWIDYLVENEENEELLR